MASADLKLVINARKYIRAQVTVQYNHRDAFVSLDEKDRLSLLMKLKNLKSKLDVYNDQFQSQIC